MINATMQELADHLGLKIILANQDAPKPKQYPYGEYNILRTDFDPPHQRIRKQEQAPDDMVEVKEYYDTSIVIRLDFINKGNSGDLLDVIMNYARKSWMWLNRQGRDICSEYNFVPAIVSKEIRQEDDSVKKENKFKAGFEFALKGRYEDIYQIEQILNVDYTFQVKHQEA